MTSSLKGLKTIIFTITTNASYHVEFFHSLDISVKLENRVLFHQNDLEIQPSAVKYLKYRLSMWFAEGDDET